MRPSHHNQHRLLTLPTRGFNHEGVRRRSVYSQAEQAWKDATYLAILDTDWIMRAFFKPAPRSLWDEMFSRHDRERQALLRWEEYNSRTGGIPPVRVLKRTGSVETVRALSEAPEPSASTSGSVSVAGNDARSSASARDSGARLARPAEKREWDDEESGSQNPHVGQSVWTRPHARTRSLSPESSDVSILGDSDVEEQNLAVDEWRANVGTPPPRTPSVYSPQRPGSPEGSIDSQWDLVEDPFMGAS